MIDETCQIRFLSATYEGKANDKILAELEGYRLPPGSYLYQDLGFQVVYPRTFYTDLDTSWLLAEWHEV